MTGLLQVPFFEDEIFTSFVSRTARVNGFKLSASFTEMLGVNYDKLLVGDSAELETFRSRAGLPDGWISFRSFSLDMGSDVSPRERAYQRKLISKKHVRYCPVCLAEDEARHERIAGTRRYRRKAWIFRAVKSCAKHNCAIVESPVVINTRNRDDFCLFLDRLDAGGEMHTDPKERSCSQLEAFIHDRLAGTHSHGPLLDSLPLPLAIDFSLILGAAAEFGKSRNPAKLSDEEEQIAGDRGFQFLLGGTGGVEDALDEITAGTSLRLSSVVGGEYIYGKLYRTLAHQRFDPEYDQIRMRVRNHAMARFPILDGADLFGSVDDSRWTSTVQIARSMNISVGPVEKVARRLGVPLGTPISKEDGARIHQTLTDDAREKFTQAEAARLVGCSIGHFRAIEAHGLLGPTDGSTLLDSVLKERTSELLSAINKAVNSDVQPNMVTIAGYSRKYGVAYAEALSQVIGGRFQQVARQDRPKVFDALMVLDEGQASDSTEFVSTEEAATILQVRDTVVFCLVRDGMLTLVKTPERYRMSTIRRKEFESFRERFISTKEFAQECRISSRALAAAMRQLSIQAVISYKKQNASFLDRECLSRIRGLLLK